MGREIKRVAFDFDWPMSKPWRGYLTPERFRFPSCAACDGTGLSPGAYAIERTFYTHQTGDPRTAWHDKIGQPEVDNLIERGRLRTWIDGKWESLPLTAAMVNAANVRAGMGDYNHDGINRGILVQFRCERLGITVECGACEGHGDVATSTERAEADAWTSEEPPKGEGWQVWETVSEGAPITPVLPTAEALIDYLCTVGDDWTRKSIAEGRGTRQLPRRSDVEAFVRSGFAMSVVADSSGVRDGYAAARPTPSASPVRLDDAGETR